VVQGRTDGAFLCFYVFLIVCRLIISGLFSSHLRVFTDGEVPCAGYTRCRLIELVEGLLLHEKEPGVEVARSTLHAQRRYVELTDNISTRANSAALADVFAESAWLAEHLDDPDVRVVEVDVSRAAYTQGHIPGAVFWNAYTDLHHADYSPLERGEFEELLSRSGLAPTTTIVFYGYGPYLGFWLMKAYGHERALVLNGTRQGWCEGGLPWTKALPEPLPSTYTLAEAEAIQLMSLDTLQGTLGSGNPLIIDVRSEAEFSGERFWPSGAKEGAGRPGHIPGAMHLHIDLLHTVDGSFKSAAELRQLFQAYGVLPERSVVTYCTIGARASEAALILRYLLGYADVRVYFGSWAEWGTRAQTAIETSGSRVN
jgi:thiosulfate/3-mercaptopyruvate sulfurtransferase